MSGEYVDDRLVALESLDHVADTHALEIGLPFIESLFQNIDARLEMSVLAKILRTDASFVEIFLKSSDRFAFLVSVLADDRISADGVDCLEIIFATCPHCANGRISVPSDCAQALPAGDEPIKTIAGGRRFCDSRVALVKSHEEAAAVVLNLVRHGFSDVAAVILAGDESLCSIVVLQGVFDLLPFPASLARVLLRDNVINQRIFLESKIDKKLLFELSDVVLDAKNASVALVKDALVDFLKNALRTSDFAFLYRMASVDERIARCCAIDALIRNACDAPSEDAECCAEVHATLCSAREPGMHWDIGRDYRRGLFLLVDRFVAQRSVASQHPLVALLNFLHHGAAADVPFGASLDHLLCAAVCRTSDSAHAMQIIFDLSASPLQKGLCVLLLASCHEKINLAADVAVFYLKRARHWAMSAWMPAIVCERVCRDATDAIAAICAAPRHAKPATPEHAATKAPIAAVAPIAKKGDDDVFSL